jgi:hypothetical protein
VTDPTGGSESADGWAAALDHYSACLDAHESGLSPTWVQPTGDLGPMPAALLGRATDLLRRSHDREELLTTRLAELRLRRTVADRMRTQPPRPPLRVDTTS